MEIEKKAWPDYFDKVLTGEKTFDVRLADWKCNAGDTLILKEYDPKTNKYTGRELKKTVSYVLKTKELEQEGMWSKDAIAKHGFQIIAFS